LRPVKEIKQNKKREKKTLVCDLASFVISLLLKQCPPSNLNVLEYTGLKTEVRQSKRLGKKNPQPENQVSALTQREGREKERRKCMRSSTGTSKAAKTKKQPPVIKEGVT